MRVKLRNEERIFEGTATQIAQQMQKTAIFEEHLTLDAYVSSCAESAGRMGLDVKVMGETTEERCASLLGQMVAIGFAERC
jgi:hypothetical protein